MADHNTFRKEVARVSAEIAKDAPILLTSDGIKVMTELFLCPICKQILFVPESLDTCGHHFCFSCLVKHEYSRISRECPVCRAPYSKTSDNLLLKNTIRKLFPQEWAERAKENWLDGELEQRREIMKQEIRQELLTEMKTRFAGSMDTMIASLAPSPTVRRSPQRLVVNNDDIPVIQPRTAAVSRDIRGRPRRMGPGRSPAQIEIEPEIRGNDRQEDTEIAEDVVLPIILPGSVD